jgi:hypothetical protein
MKLIVRYSWRDGRDRRYRVRIYFQLQ